MAPSPPTAPPPPIQVFRRAKSFFEQQNIDLFGGLSLTKTADRAGKSLDDSVNEIESAATVEARESALENFFSARAANFFTERSLNLDLAGASRSLSAAIPEELKETVRGLVVEERGKKKKILKKLLPLLGLLKVKFAVLGVIALFGIAIIAKKALLLSVLSIAISAASFFRNAIGKLGGGGGSSGSSGWSSGSSGHGHGHEEIIAYTNGGGAASGGWSSGGGSAGAGGWGNAGGYESYGEHGSHSSPVAQSIAYSGHHKQ